MSNPNAPTSDYRALLILAGATLLMAVVHLLPVPAPIERAGELIPLTPEGKTCLAILLFAVTLWVGEAMPFAVTSLLVVVLIAAFGITDFASAVNAGFGNPLIVFFIGVLFLSTGFTFSGLGTRMVLHVLRWAGTRADRVLLGFLIVGALLSMWITDMAVAAVMLPLGVGVLKDAGLKPLQSNYGRALMISCAYGPLIGGIGTPAGTAANVLALSYLEEISGVTVSFGQWMVLGVPAAILMIPVGWWLLLRIFPPEIETLPYGEGEIEAKIEALGPLKPVERKTLVIFALTITGWLVTPWLADLTGGLVDPPVQAVALAGGLTLFLPMIRVMSWKEAQANMDWGGVMLIVAGLSLGLMVFETGAARWLAQLLLGNLILIPAGAAPLRHRPRGGGAAPAVLQQHRDRLAHHADPARPRPRPRPRRLDHRRPRRLHLDPRVHPRHREPDQRAPLLGRLLLHPRHGQGGPLDDAGGGGVRDGDDHRGGTVRGVRGPVPRVPRPVLHMPQRPMPQRSPRSLCFLIELLTPDPGYLPNR